MKVKITIEYDTTAFKYRANRDDIEEAARLLHKLADEFDAENDYALFDSNGNEIAYLFPIEEM